MLLQGRQEHVLEKVEGTARDGNQPSKKYVSCVVLTVQGGSRQELGRAGKDYHVLPPAVINAEKQVLNVSSGNSGLDIFSFLMGRGQNVLRIRHEVVEEIINFQISMHEQRGQTEQAKRPLCTLLHLRRHE